MKRLYFLLPNPTIANRAADELLNSGISLSHLRAATASKTSLTKLRRATVAHTSQMKRGILLGLLVGGLAGLAGAMLALAHPPPNMHLYIGYQLVGACAGIAAIIGGLMGGILAQDRVHPDILPYEGAIMRGAVLLIADVPAQKVEQIVDLVRNHYPQAMPCIGTTSAL